MVNSINSMGGMGSAYVSQVPGRQQRGVEDLLEKIDTNSDGSVSAADELMKALLAAIKQYASTMEQDSFSSANSLISNGLLSTVV